MRQPSPGNTIGSAFSESVFSASAASSSDARLLPGVSTSFTAPTTRAMPRRGSCSSCTGVDCSQRSTMLVARSVWYTGSARSTCAYSTRTFSVWMTVFCAHACAAVTASNMSGRQLRTQDIDTGTLCDGLGEYGLDACEG